MATDQFFHVKGLAALNAKLRRLPTVLIRRVVADALRTGGRVILRQARTNARRKGGTGTLARSVFLARDKKARSDGPAYAIYTRRGRSYQLGMRQGRAGSNRRANRKNMDGFYAHMVELGTRPHEIEVHKKRGRRSMVWYSNGGPVFARRVQHPGTKPTPFLGPALSSHGRRAVSAMRARLAARIEREAERA